MDMTKTHEQLVENLRYYMGKKGMTASDLARKSGVSLRQITYIFSNERSPKFPVIEKLANALSVKPWQLITPLESDDQTQLILDAANNLGQDEVKQVIDYIKFLSSRSE